MPEDNREEELDELDELDDQDELPADDVDDLGEESGESDQEPAQETEQEPEEAQPVPVVPQPVSTPAPLLSAVEPAVEKTVDASGNVIWGPPKPEPPKRELDDLFAVPQDTDNDMYVDDLFELDEDDFEYEEEDLSDIAHVSREDIMGTPPKPRPQRFRRTEKPHTPPTMGGLR